MSYKPSNPNGQATMANSEPVVLASDHSDVKITLDGETVAVASSALPTGASTSANQTTIIGHLDGVEGLLTTIDADTSNISTKIDTLAGAVAGTEMQVDVLTMPTVTVTATNLDVQSGGADLATSTQAGAIQTAVELIDDAVYTDGTGTPSKGIAVMGTDGTNPQIISTNTTGHVNIADGGNTITVDGTVNAAQSGTWNITNISGTVSLPTGASTSANQSTIITGIQLLDDAIVADDAAFTPATTKVNMAGFEVDETTTDTLDEGDAGAARIDASRRQLMRIVGATDANRADVDASGHLQVDIAASSTSITVADGGGSITVDNNGTFAVQASLSAGTNNIGDVDVLSVPAPLSTTGTGTSTSTLRVVSASDSPDVTALQIMDDWDNAASDGASVSGDVAHDITDAGEPVKIGFKAYELDGTAPQTAVAEADRVNAISDLVGRQFVATEHPRFFHVSADYASAQTNTSVRAAPGVGLALYITDIMISNGATAGNITLLDGSGGTVLFEIYPAVNGGVALNLKNPIKLTDNTALCITSTTVTTHSIFVSGFID